MREDKSIEIKALTVRKLEESSSKRQLLLE